MLAKAATLEADEVVVDLEDGVAVEEKEAARANLAGAHALGRKSAVSLQPATNIGSGASSTGTADNLVALAQGNRGAGGSG